MVAIQAREARGILTKASGFAEAFDYTLNPYSGCAFACTYCYAAFFTPTQEKQDSWGQWVEVKANALTLLQKKRRKPLIDKTVYMSSVTDPYQSVERDLELTRALLTELADYHQVKIVVQTRSPLVTRDLDVLRRFPYARVNMTVTTDDETVRRAFEPTCPPNPKRLAAVQTVQDAGIDACITMTPMLPVRNAAQLAEGLRATGVQKFVIQNFHPTKSEICCWDGRAGAGTALAEMGWDEARYREVKATLSAALPELREGKTGFQPVW